MESLGEADPRSVGGYPLFARLGAGGMGQVFLARTVAGRPLALKTVRAEFGRDPDFGARFAREIRNADLVRSPWTAAVVDFSPEGADPQWLATEYVAAPSLADWVGGHGPLPETAVLALAAELCEALGAVHSARLAHRDVKPSNVLLPGTRPLLIDFGIARAAEDVRHTRTGVVIGSPGYMAPEQATAGIAAEPGDLFALGALLVYAATGHGPFHRPGEEASTPALLYRVVHEDADLAGVPAALAPLVGALLAKDPDARPTAREAAGLLAGPAGPDGSPPGSGPRWADHLPPGLEDELRAREGEMRAALGGTGTPGGGTANTATTDGAESATVKAATGSSDGAPARPPARSAAKTVAQAPARSSARPSAESPAQPSGPAPSASATSPAPPPAPGPAGGSATTPYSSAPTGAGPSPYPPGPAYRHPAYQQQSAATGAVRPTRPVPPGRAARWGAAPPRWGATPPRRSGGRRRGVGAVVAVLAVAVVLGTLMSLHRRAEDARGNSTGSGSTGGGTPTATAGTSDGRTLPASWVGTWVGTGPGDPPVTGPFGVTITLHAGARGSVVGTQVSRVKNLATGHEIGCTESLRLRSMLGSTLWFEAASSRPTAGGKGLCLPGHVYMVRRDAAADVLRLGPGPQAVGSPAVFTRRG